MDVPVLSRRLPPRAQVGREPFTQFIMETPPILREMEAAFLKVLNGHPASNVTLYHFEVKRDVPDIKAHYPSSHTTIWCGDIKAMSSMAKNDFWRGKQEDYFGNIPYAKMVTALVQLRQHPKIKTIGWKYRSMGTWFEAMIGIAYTAATAQSNLRNIDDPGGVF